MWDESASHSAIAPMVPSLHNSHINIQWQRPGSNVKGTCVRCQHIAEENQMLYRHLRQTGPEDLKQDVMGMGISLASYAGQENYAHGADGPTVSLGHCFWGHMAFLSLMLIIWSSVWIGAGCIVADLCAQHCCLLSTLSIGEGPKALL